MGTGGGGGCGRQGILRDATFFFPPRKYVFLASIRRNIFFINNILREFFYIIFPHSPSSPPPPITFLVLLPIPNHTQVRLSALSRTPSGYDRRSNVKLNDTAVWKKKKAFEKLWKCHFTIGIKSMILLIVLTAACWKSSGLRQQYSITVVRLAGHHKYHQTITILCFRWIGRKYFSD